MSFMIDQVAVSIIAPIKAGQEASLRTLLQGMGKDSANNDLVPFAKLRGVHFGRLFILDATTDLNGVPIPAYLVYLSDVDGSIDAHLSELVDLASPGLDRLYQNCVDYPPPASATRAQRLSYLRGHLVGSAVAYVNTTGRTVQQVRQEAELRDAIQDFLDRPRRNWSGADPGQIQLAIQKFVAATESLSWAQTPIPTPNLRRRFEDLPGLIGTPLLLLLVSPFILVALPFWLALLRRHERRDAAPHVKPDLAHVQALAALEDHAVQNQFTAVGFVKPGRFRWLTMKLVLRLVSYGVRYLFNQGDLAGVKTIHFARWIPIDRDRRVIFASNYDGSLESYMDDFIDKEAWGLNAVFSNGVGYPKTNWLLLDGAKDEQAFKDYLRVHQIPTPVWYSAYDRLSAANIANNAKIRDGLFRSGNRSRTEEWLKRI
ncbi:MAG TPA: hypothetical protein VFZ25_05000 [Chloroflexota bacterium]|nr:hypothetical protein [Chloroflexota bacterium]